MSQQQREAYGVFSKYSASDHRVGYFERVVIAFQQGDGLPWRRRQEYDRGVCRLRAAEVVYVGCCGLKVLLALSLLVSFWKPELMRPAAIGMAILMLGAVGMHIKIGDAFKKTIPALSVLILSWLVAFN